MIAVATSGFIAGHIIILLYLFFFFLLGKGSKYSKSGPPEPESKSRLLQGRLDIVAVFTKSILTLFSFSCSVPWKLDFSWKQRRPQMTKSPTESCAKKLSTKYSLRYSTLLGT